MSIASAADGSRGVFCGGAPTPPPSDVTSNIIEYITISTPGNSTNFGLLTKEKDQIKGTSDTSRAVITGGTYGATTLNLDDVDYFAIGTPANAADFGNMSTGRVYHATTGDGSRAVSGAGKYPAIDNVEYLTIGTPGAGATFGTLTSSRYNLSCTSDGFRGIFVGGGPGYDDKMDYLDIGGIVGLTAGDFGNLVAGKSNDMAGISGD